MDDAEDEAVLGDGSAFALGFNRVKWRLMEELIIPFH